MRRVRFRTLRAERGHIQAIRTRRILRRAAMAVAITGFAWAVMRNSLEAVGSGGTIDIELGQDGACPYLRIAEQHRFAFALQNRAEGGAEFSISF